MQTTSHPMVVLLGICLNPQNSFDFIRADGSRFRGRNPTSTDSIDDPLLKELLTAFKQDSQRVAHDILQGVWMQAAISMVSLFLASSSTIRLIFQVYELDRRIFRPPPLSPFLVGDVILTIVLFVLSILSLRSFLILRDRYSRISALAEKLR